MICHYIRWVPNSDEFTDCDHDSVEGADFCETHLPTAKGCTVVNCEQDNITVNPCLCQQHMLEYITAGTPKDYMGWFAVRAAVEARMNEFTVVNKLPAAFRVSPYPMRVLSSLWALTSQEGIGIAIPEFETQDSLQQLRLTWNGPAFQVIVWLHVTGEYAWRVFRTGQLACVEEGKGNNTELVDFDLLRVMKGFSRPETYLNPHKEE